MRWQVANKIMILGAGVYQVPLIIKAQEMQLETVVVSPQGNYPGIYLADIYLEMDTADADSVVSAAREHNISGIVTSGTDVCIPSIGRVVDELGLTGTGYEASKKSMNKVLMKQAFKDHGVPTAEFEVFQKDSKAKEFAEHIGYPVMIKAPDSSGSRGVTKVISDDYFQPAWKRAIAISRSKEVIVEQFLSGVEFGAQAFIYKDRVEMILPHGDVVTPAPYFAPIGHSMPSMLSQKQLKKTTDVIKLAVKALGIRDCVSNVDLMLVDNEPFIIEIGARMGATCLPENISTYAGMNIYEYLIRLSLNEHPGFQVTDKQPNAGLLIRSNKTGTVSAIRFPDEVIHHSDLIEFHLDIDIGDHVRKFRVGTDRIGHIIAKADSAKNAELLVENLAQKVKIDVEALQAS